MKTLRTIEDFRDWREGARKAGRTVGLVPTLGGLHRGHVSLIERAARENVEVAVSIFKNPTQFDDPRDLARYPAEESADLACAAAAGSTAVFLPSPEAIYSDDYRFRVSEHCDSAALEGVHRPGHFEGVLTVVLKLLLITRPERAYFGEKDFQQLRLVRDMAAAFFLESEIISCPTVRDADGLALSSRNALLSAEEREQASAFPRLLRLAPDPETAVRELELAGFGVDYVAERWGRRLGAVRLGKVRLLDNFDVRETGTTALVTREEAGVR